MNDFCFKAKNELCSEDPVIRRRAISDLVKLAKEDESHSDFLFEFLLCKLAQGDVEAFEGLEWILRKCPKHIVLVIQALQEKPAPDIRNCLYRLLKCASDLTAIVSSIPGEKDPSCLKVIFEVVEAFDECKEEHIEQVFEAFNVYFPINFKSGSNTSMEEQLRHGLREVLCKFPLMAHLSIPFLNDKLSSTKNNQIRVECVKALGSIYQTADRDAVESYYKETVNILLSTIDDCEAIVDEQVIQFFGRFKKKSPEYFQLIFEHISFGLKDPSKRLASFCPSLIRAFGGVSREACEFVECHLVPSFMPFSIPLHWACYLAFICASSECKYHIRNHVFLFSNCIEKLNSQSRKDVLFALSLVEASLRDPLVFSDDQRKTLIDMVFDKIGLVDDKFASLILKSILKNEKTVRISKEINSQVLIDELMGSDHAITVLESKITSDSSYSFVKSANLSSIAEEQRVSWIEKCTDLDTLDSLICSLSDEAIIQVHQSTVNGAAKYISALSLPPTATFDSLILEHPGSPEVLAALINKINFPLPQQINDFHPFRALVLRQDERIANFISTAINEPWFKFVLSDEYSRVNHKHRFICTETFKQWFVSLCISNSIKLSDLTSLLKDCPFDIQAMHLDMVLKAPSLDLSELIYIMISHDPACVQSRINQVADVLIETSKNSEKSKDRFYSMNVLCDCIARTSAACIIPFIESTCLKLKPLLGDSKAAVRKASVRCVDSLYSKMT